MNYKTFIGVIAALVLSTSLLQAASLKADSSVNTPEMRIFLSETENLLPRKFMDYVGSYKVDFKDMGALPKNLCTEKVSLKDLVDTSILIPYKHIYLHKGFKAYLSSKKAKNLPCEVEHIQKIARQALVYELAKLYDVADAHWENTTDKNEIFSCSNRYPDKSERNNISLICSYYLENSHKVSNSPSYKNLSDFKGLRTQSKNELEQRLINSHELDSPQEHFAYNLAKFLTDPSYQCRKPSFYSYFKNLLGQGGPTQSACSPVSHIYTTTGAWKIDIDPKKVYQVHFLYAAKGEELMSRWGHSMLRFIVCAPTRETVGPECLSDVAFHLVFSYRANVDDVIVNYWDGLIGKYPSQLMAFSMNEVVDEYTRGQWRDLISLPLNLSATQQDLLVQSALEHYWSYTGEYKFLTNNCASETDQLIRSALPKNHPYQDSQASSPVKLYKNLKRSSLVDESLLRDKKEARRKGLLFSSQKESLEKAFNYMQPYFMGYRSLQEWAESSIAAERSLVYKKLESFQDLGNAYVMEKYALLIQQRIQGNLITRLLQGTEREKDFIDVIKNLNIAGQNRLPWSLAKQGYGVPLSEEIVSDEEVNLRLQQGIQWGAAYKNLVLKKFPDIDTEIVQIKENLELLTNLRRL